MVYRLMITEHADELLDALVCHLLNEFQSEQAAKHLINSIEKIYDRLQDNPLQFPICRDTYLANKGYREAVVSKMDYVVIFGVKDQTVNVVGIFHQLENYPQKLIPHRP